MASDSLSFLHCMRQEQYLVEGLQKGLMFTAHKVRFSFTENTSEWGAFIESIIPLIDFSLQRCGLSWETLSEERRSVLLMSCASINADVPMICFTEVPCGRNISSHRRDFGPYGLVVRERWLRKNGGDRVVYIGDSSPVSQRLHRCLAMMTCFSLHLAKDKLPVFETAASKAALELISYVQTRSDLQQAEWRIAGRTGFHGGTRAVGERVALPLQEIVYVLTPGEFERRRFEEIVQTIAEIKGIREVPRVLTSVEVLP